MSREGLYPRTAAELLMRLDIPGIKKNIEQQKEYLTKVENELNNMISSLIINLSSVLENQSEVSLWFYSGVPTKNNKPYTNWTTPSEHEGDIYYDKNTGYVYQYLNDNWTINEDYNLVQAMALTNAELQDNENERKVFFTKPTVPYSSGDWWIKEDGTLFVCQLGRTTGTYTEGDFISSAKYTATIAVAQGSEIKVLKGTVTQISENYVSITDLATGGSTIIAGENIKTGCITSANFISGTKGMKINLNDGTIETKNTKWDEYGNIILSNGSKIVSDNGLLSAFKYDGVSTHKDFLGFWPDDSSQEIVKSQIRLDVYIPSNFVIKEAKVTLIHKPVSYTDYLGNTFYGYSRNVRLYKASNTNFPRIAYIGSEYYDTINSKYLTEISSAFGSSGYTPSTPSSTSTKEEIKTSTDIKANLSTGQNTLIIQTNESAPTFSNDLINKNAWIKTGQARAILTVIGFMK